MRLHEIETLLEAAKPLANGANYQGYVYNAANNTWVHPSKGAARGLTHRQIMNQQGYNDSGEPLKPTLGQRIGQKLGGPFAAATRADPKAGLMKKAGATLGSMLGRATSALVRPKQQAQAAPAAEPAAPQMGQGDIRPTANATDQALGNLVNQMRAYQPQTGAKVLPAAMSAGVMKDLANVRNNKDWAVMTGTKIMKFANAGYDVADLHKKWSQEVAIGKKQKIMQDIYSEDLEILKKLAGI